MGLDLLVSVLIGVLAGLGVGSGGILILYLIEFDGIAQLAAQGINLAVFVFGLTAAMTVHARRRLPPVPMTVICLFGGVGAAVGALLAPLVGGGFLRIGLGALMVVMGGVSLFRACRSFFGKGKKRNFSSGRT